MKKKSKKGSTRSELRSRGARIVGLLNRFNTTRHILIVNHKEFSHAIAQHEQNCRVSFKQNGNMEVRIPVSLHEFIRLLHNYVASSYTIIDHIRVICKDLNNSQFDGEHQQKLEELRIGERTAFLKHLRSFVQHYDIPPVAFTFPLPKDWGSTHSGGSPRVILETQMLLHWRKWPSDCRQFIKAHGETMDLINLINDYQHIITGLHDWIHMRICELYSKEIAEFNKSNRIYRAKEKRK